MSSSTTTTTTTTATSSNPPQPPPAGAQQQQQQQKKPRQPRNTNNNTNTNNTNNNNKEEGAQQQQQQSNKRTNNNPRPPREKKEKPEKSGESGSKPEGAKTNKPPKPFKNKQPSNSENSSTSGTTATTTTTDNQKNHHHNHSHNHNHHNHHHHNNNRKPSNNSTTTTTTSTTTTTTTTTTTSNGSKNYHSKKQPLTSEPRGMEDKSLHSILELNRFKEGQSETHCIICCDPIVFFSRGPCDHIDVCALCILKQRELYKIRHCYLCKAETKKMIFTQDGEKRYAEYDLTKLKYNAQQEIYYTSEPFEKSITSLLNDKLCQECGAGFENVKKLEIHLKQEHNLVYCGICLEDRKAFLCEQNLYDPKQIPLHLADWDGGADQKKGKKGHPICKFCNRYFYGNDQLYDHLNMNHFTCNICEKNGILYQYFKDYNKLRLHSEDEHFPCHHPECLEQKYVVFPDEVTLRSHQIEVHLDTNGMSKSQIRKASQIQLPYGSSSSFSSSSSSSSTTTTTTTTTSTTRRRDDFPPISGNGTNVNLLTTAPQSFNPDFVKEKEKEITQQEIDERNKTLIETIKSTLNSDKKYSHFKQMSVDFKNGKIGANEYYSLFSSLLGSRANQIFDELVALLPDANKREELKQIHNFMKHLEEQFPSLNGGLGGSSSLASQKNKNKKPEYNYWTSAASNNPNLNQILKTKPSRNAFPQFTSGGMPVYNGNNSSSSSSSSTTTTSISPPLRQPSPPNTIASKIQMRTTPIGDNTSSSSSNNNNQRDKDDSESPFPKLSNNSSSSSSFPSSSISNSNTLSSKIQFSAAVSGASSSSSNNNNNFTYIQPLKTAQKPNESDFPSLPGMENYVPKPFQPVKQQEKKEEEIIIKKGGKKKQKHREKNYLDEGFNEIENDYNVDYEVSWDYEDSTSFDSFRFKHLNNLPEREVYKFFQNTILDEYTATINKIRLREFLYLQHVSSNKRNVQLVFQWAVHRMRIQDIEILNEYFYHFKRSKNSALFLELLQYIQRYNIAPDTTTFSLSLGFYMDNGRFQDAKSLTETIIQQHGNFPSKLYPSMLQAMQTDSDMVDRIVMHIYNNENYKPEESLVNSIVKIYAVKHHDEGRALSLFQSLYKYELMPYVSTIIDMIELYVFNNRLDMALEFFKLCLQRYRQVVLQHSTLQLVFKILSKYQDTVLHIVDYCTGIPRYSSPLLYSSAISVYSKFHKNHDMVVTLYNRMVKHFVPDYFTMKKMLTMSMENNNFEELDYWLGSLEALKYQIDSHTYAKLMSMFLRNNDVAKAEDIYKKYNPKEGLTVSNSDAANTALFIKTQNVDQVQAMIQKIIDHTDETYKKEASDLTILLLLLMDEYQSALEWFTLKETKFGVKPTAYTFNLFITYHTIRLEYREWAYWSKNLKALDLPEDESHKILMIYMRKVYSKNIMDDRKAPTISDIPIECNGKIELYDITSPETSPKYHQTNVELRIAASSYFRNRIIGLLKEKNKEEMASREVLGNEENGFPVDTYTYKILLETLAKRNKYKLAKDLYKRIKMKRIPIDSTVEYDFIDLAYTQGKAEFENFRKEMAGNISNFEMHYFTVLINWNIKLALDLLQKNWENLSKLSLTDSIRNVLLNTLSRHGQMERCSKLITTILMSKQCLNLNYLDNYLRHCIEREYISPITQQLETYFTEWGIPVPLNFKNLLISNLYLTGRYQEGYQMFQALVGDDISRTTAMYNSVTTDLGLKLTAKIYPIPPTSNIYKHWTKLRELRRNDDRYFFVPFFKCLIEAGQHRIAYTFVSGDNFFKHSSPTIILLSLQVCPNDEAIIRVTKKFYQHGGKFISPEIRDIIRKANQSIKDPQIIKILKSFSETALVNHDNLSPDQLHTIDKIIDLNNNNENDDIINDNNNNDKNDIDDDDDLDNHDDDEQFSEID
eukprot:gene5935-7390_t